MSIDTAQGVDRHNSLDNTNLDKEAVSIDTVETVDRQASCIANQRRYEQDDRGITETVDTVNDSAGIMEVRGSTSSSHPTTVHEEPEMMNVEEDNMGRGQREKKRSKKLTDYVVYTAQGTQDSLPLSSSSRPASTEGGMVTYPISNYVSCSRFSDSHQAFLAAVMSHYEPSSYAEAVKDKRWRNAVSTEMTALDKSRTWDVVDLPPNKRAIGCRWVFTIKYRSNGEIERFKARLVAFGNKQTEGLDFDETFAPVVKMTTVRMFLKVAAVKKWEVHQMDVHNAFLHGDLEEEVYMKLPPGFKAQDPKKVCRLRKSLYGLRQAPRCWFAKLTAALRGYGFVQSHSDYSVFTLTRGSMRLYILIYVDDLLIGGNDGEYIKKFKEYLSQCFHMKDLGPVKYFLGIEVSRSPKGIYLSQRKYALDIVAECGLLASRPVATPIEQNHRLAVPEGDYFGEPERYRRLVGRLVYLTHTRPELSYAVHLLAQFMQSPRVKHWEAVTRVVRYLKGCPGQGILLSADSDLQISAYCDSDYAACPISRKCLSGFMVKVGDSPVAWKTKKQDTVSCSSAEAEYRAMGFTTRELKWDKALLLGFGVNHSGPMRLFCDNQAALHIAANPVFHERTKHMEVDCHFIRDEIQSGVLATSHVRTTEQQADIFTKALGSQQFTYLRSKLGIRDLHAPT